MEILQISNDIEKKRIPIPNHLLITLYIVVILHYL